MLQSLKSLLIITAIVVAWAVSSALLGRTIKIALPCMSFGVFIAGLMLLQASSNENSWRRLTWQPYDAKISAGLLLGVLVFAPIIILFAAFLGSLGNLTLTWLIG